MNTNNPSYVLGYKTAYIRDLYILGHALGRGRYGSTTYECTEISTRIKYACKSIPKAKLICEEDVEDIRREIQIMHHLANKRNIASIKGEYEDDLEVHIVMELCFGGELFYPCKEWYYSEKTVSDLVRIIVGVIATCHSNGVMIRGLKLDDFMLVSKHDILSIKAVDFGSSIFFKPGEEFTKVVGSPYYIAPEVHFKQYGPEVDIWSAGVILYILLSGVPPFWGETRKEVRSAILKATRYTDFESDPWPLISDSAKDLLKNMLCSRPSDRFTAAQVLRHPWIYRKGVAPDTPLPPGVLSHLAQFSAMVKLQKYALWQVQNVNLDPEESTTRFQYSNKNQCESSGPSADESRDSQQADYPGQNGYDSSGSIAESQKASYADKDGYDSCGTCAESQKAYCPRRGGNGSCGSIADESHYQASDPGQDGYDSCGTCAESQKAYCPRRVGHRQCGSVGDDDSFGTCAESQKAYCPRRGGNGSCGPIANESHYQASDPGQDGYDSCGTCAESQKAYCPRRVGHGQCGSVADDDSCGTCAESQKAYCPRRVGHRQCGSVADDDSCGTCAESQKAYCPRRVGHRQCGSVGDDDSCGTCAESQKAYCPRRGGNGSCGSIANESHYQASDPGQDGYDSCGTCAESQKAFCPCRVGHGQCGSVADDDSCGSMADEPNPDYNSGEDGYNSNGSIDESHNAHDQSRADLLRWLYGL